MKTENERLREALQRISQKTEDYIIWLEAEMALQPVGSKLPGPMPERVRDLPPVEPGAPLSDKEWDAIRSWLAKVEATPLSLTAGAMAPAWYRAYEMVAESVLNSQNWMLAAVGAKVRRLMSEVERLRGLLARDVEPLLQNAYRAGHQDCQDKIYKPKENARRYTYNMD